MPFRIQRVPQGLLNLLSISGGGTPTELEDRVQANLDLTQLYGMQQRQCLLLNDPVLTEANVVGIFGNTHPALQRQWAVLFGLEAIAIKTTTMTALALSLAFSRGTSNRITVAYDAGGPFGATESGNVRVAWFAPYPILLAPPWDAVARLDILGTDATANVSLVAEFGLLQ